MCGLLDSFIQRIISIYYLFCCMCIVFKFPIYVVRPFSSLICTSSPPFIPPAQRARRRELPFRGDHCLASDEWTINGDEATSRPQQWYWSVAAQNEHFYIDYNFPLNTEVTRRYEVLFIQQHLIATYNVMHAYISIHIQWFNKGRFA